MWLNLLIILGICVVAIVLGFFVYRIILNIKNKLRANQSTSMKKESQPPLATTKDIDDPSLEQPLNETDYAPDTQRKTDTETDDDDWLNSGVPEASASTIKKEDDDWLNARIEEVPRNVYKQQDDEWLNAENNQPLETLDESLLTIKPIKEPAIQSHPLVDEISVRRSENQVTEGHGLMDEATVRHVESPVLVLASPQLIDEVSIRPAENQVTEGHGLMDEATVRHVESPVLVLANPQLIDEISIRPAQTQVTEGHGLMDEATVRHVESPVLVLANPQLIDEISIRPVKTQVTESYALMDEISIRSVKNQVTEGHALMDEISIKPSPGPVKVEYELLDNLITKSTITRTEKAKPSNDTVITKPVESPIEKAEPIETISVNEITEILNEKRDFNQATIPSADAELRSTSFLARMGEGMGNLLSQAKNLYKKAKPSSDAVITKAVESSIEKAESVKTIGANEITEILKEKRGIKQATIPSVAPELRRPSFLARMSEGMGNLLSQAKNLNKKSELLGAVTKALAGLRIYIYYNNEFYFQDTNLTHLDTTIQEPQIKDFTFQVLNTVTELDEMVDGGYDLVMDFSKIKSGLKKGMVVFLLLVNEELASMAWACLTEKSKTTLRGYPYEDDLDRKACIVGDWTNPKFQDSDISSYVKLKRQQLLKEKGFTFERSIVEESVVKDIRSMRAQQSFELTYKRRTYTNISLPGILGVEFWKDRPLNETDTKQPNQMITLLVLVLPSPPLVTDLSKAQG